MIDMKHYVEFCKHKPYTIKPVGRLWFRSYSIFYENSTELLCNMSKQDAMDICESLNAAWQVGAADYIGYVSGGE